MSKKSLLYSCFGLIGASVISAIILWNHWNSDSNKKFMTIYLQKLAPGLQLEHKGLSIRPGIQGINISLAGVTLKDDRQLPFLSSDALNLEIPYDELDKKHPLYTVTIEKPKISIHPASKGFSNLWHFFQAHRADFKLRDAGARPSNRFQNTFLRALNYSQVHLKIIGGFASIVNVSEGAFELEYKRTCHLNQTHEGHLSFHGTHLQKTNLNFSLPCKKDDENLSVIKARVIGHNSTPEIPIASGPFAFHLSISEDSKGHWHADCRNCTFRSQAIDLKWNRTLSTTSFTDTLFVWRGNQKSHVDTSATIQTHSDSRQHIKIMTDINGFTSKDFLNQSDVILKSWKGMKQAFRSYSHRQKSQDFSIKFDLRSSKKQHIAFSNLKLDASFTQSDARAWQENIGVTTHSGSFKKSVKKHINGQKTLSVDLKQLDLNKTLWKPLKEFLPLMSGKIDLKFSGKGTPKSTSVSEYRGRGQLRVLNGQFSHEMKKRTGIDQFKLFVTAFNTEENRVRVDGPQVIHKDGHSLSKVDKKIELDLRLN